MKIKLFVIFTALLLAWSCKKPKTYPSEPFIEYDSFILTDTVDILDNPTLAGDLYISFVDGDGDMGLTASDTVYPYDTGSVYHYNVYVNLYAKENNEFVEQELAVPLRYRMTDITPAGQNKTLKGKFGIRLYYYNSLPYDTIKYEVYIYDRALNKSNVIITPELVLE